MSIFSTLRVVSILALLLIGGGALRSQEIPGEGRSPEGSSQGSLPAAGPQLRVVNAYVFGSLVCTDQDMDTIMVYNDGDANLSVTPSLFGANLSDFTILPPNDKTFTVRPRARYRCASSLVMPQLG